MLQAASCFNQQQHCIRTPPIEHALSLPYQDLPVYCLHLVCMPRGVFYPCIYLSRSVPPPQAQEAAAGPQGLRKAQAAGRVLAPLRCSELEAGLLGRTLLSLISNKVWRRPLLSPLMMHL